ncbi:MAG: hypothetical protein ACKO4T_03520 [Planctomycetaceae bacterium]
MRAAWFGLLLEHEGASSRGPIAERILFGLAAVVACCSASADGGGDRERLQGRWQVVTRTAFNARQAIPQREAELAVDTLRLMGTEGAFVVDESVRPKRLRHVTTAANGDAPVTIHYIYMLDGDELVMARKCGIGKNDGTHDPPAEFNAGIVEVTRLRRVPGNL